MLSNNNYDNNNILILNYENPDRTEFIEQRIDALVAIYDELDGAELKIEVCRFRRHVKSFDENNQVIGGENFTAIDVLQWMVKWGFT